MKHLSKFLASLILLVSFAAPAHADRERLNRFVELVASGSSLPVVVSGSTVATFDSGGLNVLAGSAASPSLAFGGTTGFYELSNSIGVANSGAVKWWFDSTGALYAAGSGGILGVASGAVGLPGLYFRDDTNSGLLNPSADTVAITAGGAARATVNTGGLDVTGEISATGLPTASGVICRKADGDLGQCTSAVGAGGTCTCA